MSRDEPDIDVDPDTDIGTANTMLERANESHIKLWVLLNANRLLVTGLLGLGLFVGFVLIGIVFYPDFHSDIQSGDTIETLFSAMLGAIITGTTLIVTISQLVISQENGPLGDQHERMSNAMNYREYTRELIDQPTPVDPSAFLRELINATQRCANTLRDSVSGSEDDQLRAEIDEFTDSVNGNAETVQEKLDGTTFGSFDVVFAALDYNYSWKIFQVERIAHEYEDSLSEEELALLEELKTTLSMFGPAREHIKTLYFQWVLIDLSQLILYVAVPALLVAGGMLAFVGQHSFTGTTIGVPNVLLVVGGAFTVTSLPFLLLISYISRIATVAKRTLAIGPLILRKSQR